MQTPEFKWSNFLVRFDLWIWTLVSIWLMNYVIIGFMAPNRAMIFGDNSLWGPFQYLTIFGLGESSHIGLMLLALIYFTLVMSLKGIFGRSYADAVYMMGPLLLTVGASYAWLYAELPNSTLLAEGGVPSLIAMVIILVLSNGLATYLAYILAPNRENLAVTIRLEEKKFSSPDPPIASRPSSSRHVGV